MAESIAQQTIKKIDSKLECSICLEPYKEPKLLPCFHVFCKSPCLEKLVKRRSQGNSSLVCPNCCHLVTLSERGVAGLQSNFHINHLIEIREFLDRAHHTNRTICESCTEDEPAQGFCHDCQKFVCAICINMHAKLKIFTDHKIISLPEVTAEASKMISPKEKISYCPKHTKSALKLFCATCSELICMDCTVRLHKDHNYDLVDDLLAQYKAEITSSLEPVRENIQTVNKALNKFDENVRVIDDKRAKMEADIYQKINKLHQFLDQRRGELIRQLDLLTQQEIKALAMYRDKVEISLAKHRSCLEYAEGGLETGSPAEVVAMKGAVLKRVSEITVEFNPVTVQPQAGPALLLLADEEKIKKACAEFTVELDRVSARNSRVSRDKLKPVITGNVSTAVVHCITKCKNPCTDPVVVTGELVHVKSGETAAVDVRGREGNKHTLSFTPACRGRHELRVSINGQPLKAFPLSVAPNPDSLGKPTSVIGGFNCPWDVAINSKGHIVVADMNNQQICILERDGTKIRSFGTKGNGNGQFSYPHGVTVDGRDNIYVTDLYNHRVQKFSPDGQFLASVGTKGNGKLQFKYPLDIVYNKSNDKLYISEQFNHKVQVLTSDLTFCSTFGEIGAGNGQFQYPDGVCCDDTGSVFVADDNKQVQVFTAGGEFVRVIGKDRLSQPRGVAVSAGVLYVTEGGGKQVSMFTLTGEFIGLFSKGQFDWPVRVATDNEESIFVADNNKNTVQIY